MKPDDVLPILAFFLLIIMIGAVAAVFARDYQLQKICLEHGYPKTMRIGVEGYCMRSVRASDEVIKVDLLKNGGDARGK